jgi:hypothetical protein
MLILGTPFLKKNKNPRYILNLRGGFLEMLDVSGPRGTFLTFLALEIYTFYT